MSLCSALAVMSKVCLKESNGKLIQDRASLGIFFCWWKSNRKVVQIKMRPQRMHSMFTWEMHIVPNGQGYFSADAQACELLCQGRDERR